MANASTDSKMESANLSVCIICFDGSEPSYAMNKASQENDLCIEKQAIDHQTSVLHDLEPTKLPYQANSPFQDTEVPLEDRASRLYHAELFKSEMAKESTDSKMESTNSSICVVHSGAW